MRKLLFILLLAAAALPFQNCGPEPVEPTTVDTTTPKDTTKPKIEPINYFKFNGAEIYNLLWDSTRMIGTYKVSNDFTTVYIEGFSSHTTTKNEEVSLILKFKGKTTGTFKHSVDPAYQFEITITRKGIDTKYVYDNQKPSNDMIINITKYDPVDGHIKGTFSGNLAFGISTATISAGAFEAVRWPDE